MGSEHRAGLLGPGVSGTVCAVNDILSGLYRSRSLLPVVLRTLEGLPDAGLYLPASSDSTCPVSPSASLLPVSHRAFAHTLLFLGKPSLHLPLP